MQTLLNSDRFNRFTLVPFLYMIATRLPAPRDFAYLAATSWLPCIWILHRLGGYGLGAAVMVFAAGYFCFVSIYEIGYLVNDAWDADKTEGGRRRVQFNLDRRYTATFVAVRLGVWAGLGTLFGWIGDPVWLAAYAALILVVAEHNLIRSAGFRSASFFQLACLRFILPIIGETPRNQLLLLLVISIVFYAYFRFITYLEGKGQLDMPERRHRAFGVVQIAMLSPLVVYFSYVLDEPLLVELFGFYLASYGVYALVARQ